ncbi:hypothetical protein LCGC14_1064460 [marine sediment metagenome]|uniref:Uncharacterized protein n=1 Tax=marine sediment metagenome TaxID=412755 RepID=A0A0F9QR04_9ZZZZ
MDFLEVLKWSITEYFIIWGLIPLWVTIPLAILVIWFTYCKYKAPQRIARLWMVSFTSAWFSGRDDVLNKDAIDIWASQEAELALAGKLNQQNCPDAIYKQQEKQGQKDWSFSATWCNASPTEKLIYKILIGLAILVTLAQLTILLLKALGVF